MAPSECSAHAAATWSAAYRKLARRRLGGLLAAEAVRLEVAPGPLSIRDPRTRWGSCSARGAISLSWRLVLVPPYVARYVVVHELCHLVHRDHSPRFWAALERALPEWRDGHAWLRRHGGEVMAYVPAYIEAHAVGRGQAARQRALVRDRRFESCRPSGRVS